MLSGGWWGWWGALCRAGAELDHPMGPFQLKMSHNSVISPSQVSQQGEVSQGSEFSNPQDALQPKED